MRVPAKMETGEEEYIVPKTGYTVQLTVDYIIQAIMEKVADQALEDNGAVSVQAVMMNVKTGEILGMVNRPGFDLNSPPRDDLSQLSHSSAIPACRTLMSRAPRSRSSPPPLRWKTA